MLERILYVEDQHDIQEIVVLALENLGGYTLEVCSSGEEALTKVETFSPDLILLDVIMPGMDGPTTLNALRNIPALHNSPVIFMTGNAQPQEIAYLKEIGALDVIAKPFDPMTLASQISTIWEKWYKMTDE